MKKIILIGGGGHCKVVIDTILSTNEFEIIGILDLEENVGKEVLGVPVIATDTQLEDYFRKGIRFCFITVGSIGTKAFLRENLFMRAQKIGFRFPNIIHPGSVVSKFTIIGEGNYVAPGTIINAGTIIGNHCILNTGSKIDHDCNIGNFVHVAPGVTISGGVEIGDYSHIGTGSSIIQCLKIGSNTIIGAGSVVLSDIPDNVVAFGNPCKIRRKNNG